MSVSVTTTPFASAKGIPTVTTSDTVNVVFTGTASLSQTATLNIVMSMNPSGASVVHIYGIPSFSNIPNGSYTVQIYSNNYAYNFSISGVSVSSNSLTLYIDIYFTYSPGTANVNIDVATLSGIIFHALSADPDVAMNIASANTEVRIFTTNCLTGYMSTDVNTSQITISIGGYSFTIPVSNSYQYLQQSSLNLTSDEMIALTTLVYNYGAKCAVVLYLTPY
jgi:hypothetical protein